MKYLVLAALAGCVVGRQTPATATTSPAFSVARGYRPQVLAVPDDAGVDFAACPGALVFVPLRGGVLTAGWMGWLVEPTNPAIVGIACDEAQHIFGVGRTSLSLLVGGQWKQLAAFPDGDWHVASSSDGRLWVWGRSADGTWRIHQVRPDRVVTVYADRYEITAAAVVGRVGLVTALGDQLIVWSAKGTPSSLGRVDSRVDGLVYRPDGTVFVSTADGIVALKTGAPPRRVASGLHGALGIRPEALYVHSVAHHAVVRLTPDFR